MIQLKASHYGGISDDHPPPSDKWSLINGHKGQYGTQPAHARHRLDTFLVDNSSVQCLKYLAHDILISDYEYSH